MWRTDPCAGTANRGDRPNVPVAGGGIDGNGSGARIKATTRAHLTLAFQGAFVGYIDVSALINGDCRRRRQLGIATADDGDGLRTTIAAGSIYGDVVGAGQVARSPIAYQAALIRYIESTARANCHADRKAISALIDVERGVRRHIAIATRRILSDGIVAAIQHIDVAAGIQCNCEGVREFRAVAGDRGDRWTGGIAACGIDIDTADAEGEVVRNVDVPAGIDCNAGSVIDSGVIAGDHIDRNRIAAATRTIDGYAATLGWPAEAVRHVDVPIGIQRDADGYV